MQRRQGTPKFTKKRRDAISATIDGTIGQTESVSLAADRLRESPFGWCVATYETDTSTIRITESRLSQGSDCDYGWQSFDVRYGSQKWTACFGVNDLDKTSLWAD